jgi:hypothetical protein
LFEACGELREHTGGGGSRGGSRGNRSEHWWTHGIPVEAETWQQIEEIAAELGGG